MAKSRISITIDEDIFIKWKKYCNDNCINESKLIQKFIEEYLKKKR